MDFMDTATAVLVGNLLTMAAFFTFKRLEKVQRPADTPWWAIGTVLLLAFLIAGTAITARPGEEGGSLRAEAPR